MLFAHLNLHDVVQSLLVLQLSQVLTYYARLHKTSLVDNAFVEMQLSNSMDFET